MRMDIVDMVMGVLGTGSMSSATGITVLLLSPVLVIVFLLFASGRIDWRRMISFGGTPYSVEIFAPRADGVDRWIEGAYPINRGTSPTYKAAKCGLEFAAKQDEIWKGNHFKRQLVDGRLHPVKYANGILISEYSAIQDHIHQESQVEAIAKTQEKEGFLEKNKELISLVMIIMGVAVISQVWMGNIVEHQKELTAILNKAVDRLEPERPVVVLPQSNFTTVTVTERASGVSNGQPYLNTTH